MNQPLSIALAIPRLQHRLTLTRATLPLSFHAHGTDTAPSALFMGGDGDWAARAKQAVNAGTRVVIVADPGVTEPDAILALADKADAAGAVIELAERFAGDATLLRHRDDLVPHLAATSTILVNQVSEQADPGQATLDMVRTVRALGHELNVTHRWHTAHAVMVRGMVGEKQFEGIATAASAGQGQRLDALGFGRTLRIALRGDGSSRPSDVRLANAKGERKLPQVYESVDRAAWQRALVALQSGRAENAALRYFAADAAMIRSL